MNLSDFAGNSQLRVFVGNENEDTSPDLATQLPFMNDLFDRFESVTGWTLAFHENRNSQSSREDDRMATIFGELEIDDMSAKLETGKSARHRGYCDQLVETLDCMVHVIQADRQRFLSLDQHLSPVVQVPFDWWGLAGKAGYKHGHFASWSVTSDEKIRVFAGQVSADDMQSSILSSATLLSLFETVSQTSIPLDEIAPTIASVKERSPLLEAKLNWFATAQLDPITGEYELDGYEANRGLALIDVDGGTVLAVDGSEMNGVLYSGQMLAVGINDEMRQFIASMVSSSEMTVERVCEQFNQEFGQEPALLLYRK